MKISSESTPAKIGRSMKNLEKFMAVLSAAWRSLERTASRRSTPRAIRGISRMRLGDSRSRLRRHERAGAHALQAVDDDALVGLQARGHDAQAVDAARPASPRGSRPCLSVAHDHHELLVLVGADRALAHQQRLLRLAPGPCAPARTGPASAAPSALSNTARTRTVPLFAFDLVVDQLQMALERRAVAAVGAHLHGDRLDATRRGGPCGRVASARATTCSSASKLA